MKMAMVEDGPCDGRPAAVSRDLTRAVDATLVPAALPTVPRTACPRFGGRVRLETRVEDGASTCGAIDRRIVSPDEALTGAAA